MAKIKPTDFANSDDHLGKEIQIRCEGAATVPIDELQEFQGELKSLSEESYLRLKHSILELGYSFPVAAWKNRNRILILDAHQRVRTLKRMREEGYVVPPLPVVWVEAENEHDAAKKLLAATAQYGQIEVDGLHEFMEKFNLKMDEVQETFRFPEVDFDSFRLTYYHEPTLVSDDGQNGDPRALGGAPVGSQLGPRVQLSPSPTDPEGAWKGMPEFNQGDKLPIRTVYVHFEKPEDVAAFFKLLGQNDTGNTKSIWYPELKRMDTESKRYTQES